MKLLGAHQNIVSLVGCCTLQEHKFLVIEYVPYGDLLQWLRRGRRSVETLELPDVFFVTYYELFPPEFYFRKAVIRAVSMFSAYQAQLLFSFKNCPYIFVL